MISTAQAIQEMVRFFIPMCADQATLKELDEMASDDKQWRFAHALFQRIRSKTLQADVNEDTLHQYQYGFEEICAKTLYNMSWQTKGEEFPYPFDDDSPFWVLPLALKFAQALEVSDPWKTTSGPCSSIPSVGL